MRGYFFQSGLYYCYKQLRRQPKEGLRALYYYMRNYDFIRENSNYYIEVIEKLKKRIDC